MKIEVYLWDNDPLQQRYYVGIYVSNGHVMPYELYEDILNVSRKHDVYFGFIDVIDAFLHARLLGDGQATSVDCSMFLQMEVIDGD